MIERNGYLLEWVPGRKQPRGTSLGEGRTSRGGKGMYVYAHRLVMEAHLGRRLESHEVVHHINHDRHDNRIENLELFTGQSEHQRHHQNKGPKPRCERCSAECKRHGKRFCSKSCATSARHAANREAVAV